MAELEDAIEEIPDEEKLQIAQHYLLSSPPCQFLEVLTDVRKIVTTELLTDALANGMARASNLKNCKIVQSPSGSKVAISEAAEVDETSFVDPSNGSIFQTNHLTLETTESSKTAPVDDSLEAMRSSIQSAVGKYVASQYNTKTAAGGAFAKEGKILVVITGEVSNLKNFYSGKWNSQWSVVVNGQTATLSGAIKVHVHYFEDGNLQLQNSKSIPDIEIKFQSEDDLASKICTEIKKQESILQAGFEEMYGSMNTTTFRSMRRVMPITRTKMEWNLHAVRMVKQVQRK